MIIEELDKEGINLQETRLNLINQDYKWYWYFWLEDIMRSAFNTRTMEIGNKMLKEKGLI